MLIQYDKVYHQGLLERVVARYMLLERVMKLERFVVRFLVVEQPANPEVILVYVILGKDEVSRAFSKIPIGESEPEIEKKEKFNY